MGFRNSCSAHNLGSESGEVKGKNPAASLLDYTSGKDPKQPNFYENARTYLSGADVYKLSAPLMKQGMF